MIIGDHTAVEIKSTTNAGAHDLRSLRALGEETKLRRYLCVSLEPRTRRVGEITVLPWRQFLDRLWAGEYR